MKQSIILIGIALLAFSCGNNNENDSLSALKEKKDSLKTVYDEIATQIAIIDEQIKAADTNLRLPLVTLSNVEVKTFNHFVDVQGAVETGGNALLYPEAPGIITAILVKEGSRVNKGDVILKIDADVVLSTINEVETQLELAKQVYEKQERLWKEKIGSEMQYLQAKTNKESLEQKLKTVKQQANMYVVKSPITGVVDEILPKVGESANPGMPVARVINYNETYIKADVSENYISILKEGTPVQVNFPTIKKMFESKLSRVSDFISPTNRSFKIYIDLSDVKAELKPNLLADISIRDFSKDSAIVVPSSIIQQDRTGNNYIYVLEGNSTKQMVKKMVVKPGLSYQGQTLILEGLNGTEKYVDKGSRSIQDGDQVEVVK